MEIGLEEEDMSFGVWRRLVGFGLIYSKVKFGLNWFGLVYQKVKFGLVWFGLVWFGLVWSLPIFVHLRVGPGADSSQESWKKRVLIK